MLVEPRGLRWTPSPDSDAQARRGFCGECGSSLFWDPPAGATISIAVGTLHDATGLNTVGHVYVSQAASDDDLPADGLPRHSR